MGSEGAEAMLRQPLRNDGQAFPWLWAVRRSLAPDQIPASPPNTPGAWVRFLARWDGRKHTWQVKRTRADCAQAMLEAVHPLQVLACAVRLLELHGEGAIPALLKVLRTRPAEPLDVRPECAAWALGSLGPAIVPEVLDCYQGASRRVRGHLAMALWYLGPRARKALPVLLDDPSPQASAALLAMEGAACEGLVARGRGPVWLDVKGVQALARLAFGDDEKGRVFAAAGLGCYGPSAETGLPILEHLAWDPEPRVRLTVAQSLSWGERRDALDIVLRLTEDPVESVRTAAIQTLGTLFESVIPARQALLDRVVAGPVSVRKPAAVQLARIGLPPDRQEEVSELLDQAPPALLPYLLEAADICGGIGFHRQPVLALVDQDRGPEARCAVVRTLAPFLDSQGFARLRELLFDEEQEVALLAARLLARKGLARLELGERLLTVPVPALLELLKALRTEGCPGEMLVGDWLPLLGHPDDDVVALAARALQQMAGTDQVTPEVVSGLSALLESPRATVALAAARTLLELGLDEAGFQAVQKLLWHTDSAISIPCAVLLGRRGLHGFGEQLLVIPAPTLFELLESAREAGFPGTEETDLLLLLRHPDPTVLRTAAEALVNWARAVCTVALPSPDGVVVAQEPRQPTPELLAGLSSLLESADSQLRLAGARGLLHLGSLEGIWALLESPTERDFAYARLQAAETVPAGLLEALAEGRGVNALAVQLVQAKLGSQECAAVLARALSHTSPAEGWIVRDALVGLGLAGLDVLPELLGHPAADVRGQALQVLERLLFNNLDNYVEWLAERGLVLPLDHPDPVTRVGLHTILARCIEYSKAWTSLRFLPLLAELSRSPSRRAARLALTSLANRLSRRPEEEVLTLLKEAARTHPAHQVRLVAMRHLRSSPPGEGKRGLALEVASWPRDLNPRVELQRLGLEYRFMSIGRDRLRWALTRLEGPDEDSLLLPSNPGQFVQLASLLDDPTVGRRALRLLLGHPGGVGRVAWVELVRTLLRTRGVIARALAGKWPRLVVSALKAPAGVDWTTELGPAAQPGLRLAMARPGYQLRLRAIQAVGGNIDVLTEELTRMAASDPHPEVRAAAAAALQGRE